MNIDLIRNWAEIAEREPVYPNPIFPPSVYYRFLRVVTRELKPNLSVILGVCGGGDCLHACLGNPQGTVIGVDVALDHPEQMNYIYDTCSNFVFWQGDSVGSVNEIVRLYSKPSLLFVDTIHTRQRTIEEFEAWKPYLTDEAIVCFDDLNRKEMAGFWDWLSGYKVRLDNLHSGSTEGGFGVWWND